MAIGTLFEVVRKDLKIYFSDPKALIISFAVPVAIASFLTVMAQGMSSTGGAPKKIPIVVADVDGSPLSKAIDDALLKADSLKASIDTEANVRTAVNTGEVHLGLVIPKNFGMQALNGPDRPSLSLLFDPTDQVSAQAVQGVVIQSAMEAVSKAKYGALAPTKLPFEVEIQPQTAGAAANAAEAKAGAAAHSFAGMAVQGLLFFAIEAAMAMMRERSQGIWKRLRAMPISSGTLILGRAISSTIRALAVLFVVFAFGSAAFGFRVEGSFVGFLALCICVAVMAACFGLLVAALGKTEQQSRGLSILAVLGMLMLGGAWFPSFLMPDWLQKLGLIVPVRWAVDGFDNVTWRKMGFLEPMKDHPLGSAGGACLVLIAFAALFAAFAARRFRFESET